MYYLDLFRSLWITARPTPTPAISMTLLGSGVATPIPSSLPAKTGTARVPMARILDITANKCFIAIPFHFHFRWLGEAQSKISSTNVYLVFCGYGVL